MYVLCECMRIYLWIELTHFGNFFLCGRCSWVFGQVFYLAWVNLTVWCECLNEMAFFGVVWVIINFQMPSTITISSSKNKHIKADSVSSPHWHHNKQTMWLFWTNGNTTKNIKFCFFIGAYFWPISGLYKNGTKVTWGLTEITHRSAHISFLFPH